MKQKFIVKEFIFEDKELRILIDENGNYWWVAADVCNILGYDETSKAVDLYCKETQTIEDLKCHLLEAPPEGLLVVDESDIYRLAFRSKTPIAECFLKWTENEVLTEIRIRCLELQQEKLGVELKRIKRRVMAGQNIRGKALVHA